MRECVERGVDRRHGMSVCVPVTLDQSLLTFMSAWLLHCALFVQVSARHTRSICATHCVMARDLLLVCAGSY